MRNKQLLTYHGVLDTDTDHRFVKPEDHIAAKNLYSTVTENAGTKYVMPGNIAVTSDLTSDFVITGVFEEKTTNKIYYLVYNPDGADRIYVYDPLNTSGPNGTVRELCRLEGLDLDPAFIAQGEIVGGKYLVWCESNQIKDTLEYNGVKKINLERADVNKRFVYRLAVAQESTSAPGANVLPEPNGYVGSSYYVYSAVDDNVAANPIDGSIDADLVKDVAATQIHGLYLYPSLPPIVSGQEYAFEVYVKQAGHRYVGGVILASNGAQAWWGFDMQDNVFATELVAGGIFDYAQTSEDIGGGWFKISITLKWSVNTTLAGCSIGPRITLDSGLESYLGTPDDGVLMYNPVFFSNTNAEPHYYKIFDVNGVELVPETLFYDGLPEGSIQGRIEAIATALDAVSGIGAVAYPNYVEITMDTAGQRLLVYADAATVQDGLTDWPDAKYNGQSLLFWAYNHYPLTATRDMFDLCKRPMPCAPYHEFQENPDPLDKFADIRDGAWQFITRIHYIDGELSAWSEPSIVASNRIPELQDLTPYGDPGYQWQALIIDELQNLIVVRYHNSILSNEVQLSLISHVEIAVRSGYGRTYYQVSRIPIEDCIAESFSSEFSNYRVGPAIESDDAFTSSDTQVLKKFDWVPTGAGAIGVITEDSGSSKIVIGSPVEGYDNIQKSNCEIAITLSDDYISDRRLHHRLKENGEYKIGIEYLDDFGRVSDVIECATLSMPTHNDPGNSFDFQVAIPALTIKHQPPIWATRYRVVRTEDLRHYDFFQFPTSRIDAPGYTVPDYWMYAQKNPVDSAGYEFVDFDSCTHILIRLPFDTDKEVTNFNSFIDTESLHFFSPEPGDKCRILRAFYPGTNWNTVKSEDIDIVGTYIDTDTGGKYIVLERFEEGTSGGNILSGVYMVEVYRPKKVEEAIYVETGICFDVLNPGTGSRSHAGDIQDQDGATDAIVNIYGGDIMWTGIRPFKDGVDGSLFAFWTGYYFNVELKYFSQNAENICRSSGRGNLEDSIKLRYVLNRFRHSQIYQTNSLINGINSFRGIDLIDLDIQYGPISGLKMSGNTLIAICFNKVQPIYLNRQEVLGVDNSLQLGVSSKEFNLASELRGDYGCQNKESIISEYGRIYAWDKRTGTIWRYDANGINDIRLRTVTNFGEIGDERKSTLISSDRVFSGYDRRRDLFFIYFAPISGIESCWVYDEKANGWVGQIEMSPQMFSMVNDKLISFQENQLYVHDGEGAIPANLYGEQVVPEITKVFNGEPAIEKIPWTATIKAGKRWEFSLIESPPSLHFAEGQESRIRGERWRNFSGAWTAAFLRDVRDSSARFLSIPNLTTRERTALLSGRHLRGDHFVITLRLPDPEADVLFSTEVDYSKPE